MFVDTVLLAPFMATKEVLLNSYIIAMNLDKLRRFSPLV